MTFHYSLQPALDAAIARERDCGCALVRLRHIVRNELATLDAVGASERAARSQARPDGRAAPPSLLAGLVIDRERCLLALAIRRRRQNAALQNAYARLAAAENRHNKTAAERRALERLRERRYVAFAAEAERREASEYDEANALQHEARCAAARKYAS